MQLITLDSYTLHSLTSTTPCRVKLPFAGLGAPNIRLDAYNRPGEHGFTVAHSLYGERLLVLQGVIKGADAATYLANRQALEQAVTLQLDSNNVPIPRTLAFTQLDGSQYQISVVTSKFLCEQENPTFANWYLELVATKTVIESQTLSTASLTLPISGGVVFPIRFAIRFGGSSGGSATVTNSGSFFAKPVITIKGPCANPVISNLTTGEFFKLSLTLVSGDTVTIDCSARTVVQGTSTNRMGSIATGSTFWSLQSGANSLTFAADSYDVGTASIQYRSSYIGV